MIWDEGEEDKGALPTVRKVSEVGYLAELSVRSTLEGEVTSETG